MSSVNQAQIDNVLAAVDATRMTHRAAALARGRSVGHGRRRSGPEPESSRNSGAGSDVDRWEATEQEIAPYFDHVGEQERYDGRPNLVGVRLRRGAGTVDPAQCAHGHGRERRSRTLDARPVGRRGRRRPPLRSWFVRHEGRSGQLSGRAGRTRSRRRSLRGDVKVNTTVGEEDGGLGALSTVLARPSRRRGADHRANASGAGSRSGWIARLPADGAGSGCARCHAGRGRFRDREVHPGLSGPAGIRAGAQSNVSVTSVVRRDRRTRSRSASALSGHGVWPSTVPESLVAEGRAGLLPGEEIDAFKREMTERVARPPDATRGCGSIRRCWSGSADSSRQPRRPSTRRFPKRCCERMNASRVSRPNVEGVPYGADMRLFIMFGEMPCVMYGAGDVAVAHQVDEHISIDELVTATKTIACLLMDWCEVAE